MKRVLLVVLVLAAIGGTWLIYSQQRAKKAEEEAPEGVTTVIVERAPIESIVSATGSVTAERVQSLVFSGAGQVVEVLVREGDTVARDQLLARLDDEDLQLAVRQAEAALTISEAQLAKTEAGASAEDLARTQAAVEIAQAGVASAQAGVESAQAGVASAVANLSRLQSGATAEDIEITERRIADAKNRLWGAQSQRDSICGKIKYGVAPAECDSAESSVLQAEEGVRIAEIELTKVLKGSSKDDLDAARAQVTQARAQVAQAEAQMAQAQGQVKQAEADLARTRQGAAPEDIAIAEAQVEQAQVSVEVARSRLDDAQLSAPASGELVQFNVHLGDTVAPGAPVGTLVDATQYHVLVSIDETEIGSIAVGQLARIELDSFPDQILEGTVARINIGGENTQGIVTYAVRVDLATDTYDVKPLMTATVDIVAESKESALRVPNRAIKRDRDGRYVQVVGLGKLERVSIIVGVSNSTYTEVLSGLKEGDEVVVGTPRASLLEGSPFGGE